MKCFKLTNENGQSRNGMQWGEGVTHRIELKEGQKLKLCTDTCLHFYEDKHVAILLNPLHSNFNESNMLLWEAEIPDEIEWISDNKSKAGCTQLTTIRQIEKPVFTKNQKVYFAILCAKEVCEDKSWNAWADKWISGEDRTEKSAAAACAASSYAAAACAYAAAAAYANAAYANAYANANAYAYAKNIDLLSIIQKVLDWVDPIP